MKYPRYIDIVPDIVRKPLPIPSISLVIQNTNIATPIVVNVNLIILLLT